MPPFRRTPARARPTASRMAHDRSPHAEGLDRAEKRRRPSNRGLLAVASGPAGRDPHQPAITAVSSKNGCAATGPRTCSTKTAACGPSWPRWPRTVTGAWEPIPMPTAGCCSGICACPDFREYAVEVDKPGLDHRRGHPGAGPVPPGRHGRQCRKRATSGCSARTRRRRTGWTPLLEVTGRTWMGETRPDDDENLSPDGRVTEVLSEHLCQGMLEGYLLTGRHGLFSCYEAFIHIVDSMFNQHAKWLKTTRHLGWRRPVASLNYPAHVARVAPGPQRFVPPGPRLYRPRGQQEGGHHTGLSAPGRQLPAVGRRPLPAIAGTTSTSSWRASSPPCST